MANTLKSNHTQQGDLLLGLYRVSPKKAERSIFVTLILKNIAYFDSSDKTLSSEKEWYQVHLIWVGSIDSKTISWNTVIY